MGRYNPTWRTVRPILRNLGTIGFSATVLTVALASDPIATSLLYWHVGIAYASLCCLVASAHDDGNGDAS